MLHTCWIRLEFYQSAYVVRSPSVQYNFQEFAILDPIDRLMIKKHRILVMPTGGNQNQSIRSIESQCLAVFATVGFPLESCVSEKKGYL